MEYALWKGQTLSASIVGDEYEYEKIVRIASALGELMCQDPACQSRVVKYCHGKIRSPYFAHLDNSDCDYAEYDRSRFEEIAIVCGALYEILSGKGFKVLKEKKLLQHHYSHLVIEDAEGSYSAVEFIKRNFSVKRANYLTEEYQKANINVLWIEIANVDSGVQEDATYFAERFALNENNKTLIVVDRNSSRVVEYRMDTDSYRYRGRMVLADKELYFQKGYLEELTYENNSITFSGYDDKFEDWKMRRQQLFYEKCDEIDEQIIYAEKAKLNREQREIERNKLAEKRKQEEAIRNKILEESNRKKLEEEYRELDAILETSKKIIYDSTGKRVIKCRECGKIGHDSFFSVYGGAGSMNLGECKECSHKKQP